MSLKKWSGQIFLAGILVCVTGFAALAQGLPDPSPAVNRPLAAPPTPVIPDLSRPMMSAPSGAPAGTIMGPSDDDYHLGSGDKLAMTVYGEDDLKSEFVVDGSGQVQIPLVGPMKAAGLSVRDFVAQVTTSLGAYLRNPRVSIQVLNYRPFFIFGEVNKPGEFPYEAGLNVLGAVSLAGGFSSRADDSEVYIRHLGNNQEQKLPADASTMIAPGDVVRIAERFF